LTALGGHLARLPCAPRIAKLLVFGATLGVLDAALPGGLIEGDRSVDEARTLAFHTLVLFQLFDVYCIRSDEASLFRGLFSNRWLWLSVAFALLLQALVLRAEIAVCLCVTREAFVVIAEDVIGKKELRIATVSRSERHQQHVRFRT
jgi:hypothetical protein